MLRCEKDHAMVHTLLSKLPLNENVELWIDEALRLYSKYPIPVIKCLTRWEFDPTSAWMLNAKDDEIPKLMQNEFKNFPKSPYFFRPQPLINRFGTFGYVPAEGDNVKFFALALAIGMFSFLMQNKIF